jgi:hypothetical protein
MGQHETAIDFDGFDLTGVLEHDRDGRVVEHPTHPVRAHS